MPIGSVEYDSNSDDYIYGSLNVFENFTNTIALLKKYGIYKENEAAQGRNTAPASSSGFQSA